MSGSAPDEESSTQGMGDFDNYYDLLDVSKTASTDDILLRSRKLMAEYHPDSSAHSDAKQIFKEVNRAQDILTNPEQRVLYDQLGHDRYLEKRDQGNIQPSDTLTKAVKENTERIHESGSEAIADKLNTGTSRSSGQTSKTSTQQTTTDTKKGNSINFSPNIGYASLDNIPTSLTREEWVAKLFKRSWFIRVISIMGIVGILATSFDSVESTVYGLWATFGVYGLSEEVAVLLTSLLVVTVISLNAGWFFRARIPDISDSAGEDDPETDSAVDNVRDNMPFEDIATGQERRHSTRGFNTDATDGDSTSHNIGPTTSRYDDGKDENVENERQNNSLGQGKYLLLLGAMGTVIATVVGNVSPWVFVQSFVNSGQGAVHTGLWYGASDTATAVTLIMNVVITFGLATLTLGGMVLSIYGTSREAWYQSYVRGIELVPEVWDLILTWSITVALIGFYYGAETTTLIDTAALPLLFRDMVGISDVLTFTSLAVMQIFVLLALIYSFALIRSLRR